MYNITKRFLDCILAIILVILFGPFLAFVSVLILLIDGRPIFFTQVRAGLNGSAFLLWKFRTMSSCIRSNHGDESSRVTTLGRVLRKTSIDELPSLWNVIKGDLSFVGPRPLLMEYLPTYSPHHFRRHEVPPGLTGLAQISGRNLLSWKERLDIDVEYVDKQSFWLDVWIFFRSVGVVLRSQGVNQADGATMLRLEKGYEK